jgi:hypothetical protein
MPRRERAGDGEAVIERAAAVLIGMAAGHVFWLAGITALTVIVPMQHMIIATAVFLGLITITAFAIATHFKKSGRRSVALACWWVPALPAVAGIDSRNRFSELAGKNLSMKPDTTLGPVLAETKNCCRGPRLASPRIVS